MALPINLDKAKLQEALNVPTPTSASRIIFKENGLVKVRNCETGRIEISGTDASEVIQGVLNNISDNNVIFIKNATYTLSTDVTLSNKSHITILSDGAIFNNKRLRIYGDTCMQSQRNVIQGLHFYNSGIILENAYNTRLENLYFNGCSVGVELRNTKEWTECTCMENLHFENCTKGIVFKSPVSPGTDSYIQTLVKHAFFNLYGSGSVGIDIEPNANVGDSLFMNLRFWMHNDGESGIRHGGSARRTVLLRCSFESFVSSPTNTYGIKIEEGAAYPPYLIQPNWDGTFTSRIHNPGGTWLHGIGAVYCEQNRSVTVGLGNNYGPPLNLAAVQGMSIIRPRIKISVGGTFQPGETITVRIVFEYIDGVSLEITKSYTSTVSEWLGDEDYLSLYAASKMLYAILIYARTNQPSTSVTVSVSWYCEGA